MERRVAYKGEKFAIAFARERNGGCPGGKFFDELSTADQARLMALFRIAGDREKLRNPEKFGGLGGGLFEFKSFQIRMPFAYAQNERRLILVTHGFFKKRDRTPKDEIARAWRIFKEDQEQTRLSIVGRAGQ